MRPGYEEKTFESYFNSELDRRSDLYFPPGQVQEGLLGFDSSAFSRNRRLWRMIGEPFWFFHPFSGAEMREIANELEQILRVTIQDIPKIKVNLIFQYKRSEFLTTNIASEWIHWNRPYYRYDIYKEQQELLMAIHNKFGSKVHVLYAAPAINGIDNLVNTHLDRRIIERSNFKKASDLDQHGKNTFVEAGTFSIACSEPERIQNFDLLRELGSIPEEETENGQINNVENTIRFIDDFISVMKESKYYSEAFLNLQRNARVPYFDNKEILSRFHIMSQIRQLTGLQWIIKH